MSTSSKEQFYNNLNAATYCGWDWCRKLYGYQYTDASFLERVYARLEELDRKRVKYIYALYVKTQIAHEMAQMQEAGKWLVEQTNKNYERKVKEWQRTENLQTLSDKELLRRLQHVRADRGQY